MANVNKNYQDLKGALIRNGYTLRGWALKHGFKPSTVYGAAAGHRSGVIATKIRNRLSKYVSQ
ncbi:MAG TPA: hypothetical protein VM680_18515 [Verrucomicrobiae bacterium]|nr:hypothetical protein [Verrucomicrobiae bacterium]